MPSDSHRSSDHRSDRESYHRRSSRSRSPDPRRHDKDKDKGSSSSSRKDRELSSSSRRKHDDEGRREKGSSSSSKRREKKHGDDRSEGEEEEDEYGAPPDGVGEIDEDDFFLKANELKLWLHEEKHKKLDGLSGSDSRRYFRKFLKAWNRGLLSPKFYSGISSSSLPSDISTSHKWTFSKASQQELDTASSVRKGIDSTGRVNPRGAGPSSGSVSGASRTTTIGPSMPPGYSAPSAVERLQSSRDHAETQRDVDRRTKKDEYRLEARQHREEERDSRATGRERLVEKRMQGNAVNREFREGKEAGMMEFDESTLMGGSSTGSSFKDAIAARDRSKNNPRRVAAQEEKAAVMSDKVSAFRTKEQQTMDSLRALAQARFG